MTRKEPQFSDDLTRMSSIAGTQDPSRNESISGSSASSKRIVVEKSTSNWLLWLFVLVSLCISFGLAFFGLEEAGRYQAALAKTEVQAKELKETIDRLNRLQTQGIGELAQSDAQMRKMVASVETKIIDEVASRVTLVSKRMETMSTDVSKTKRDFDALRTDMQIALKNQDSFRENLSLAQNQIISERSRLDQSLEDFGLLNKQLTKIDGLTGQLIAQLADIKVGVDRAQTFATKALEDKTAVLATEVLAEEVSNNRVKLQNSDERLNGQEQINQAISREMKKVQNRVIALNEIEPRLEEMTRLVKELDAGRRQITQRIIDLDSRWNEMSQIQRKLAGTQKQIENVEGKFEQYTDGLNRLESRLDEQAKLISVQ